MLFENALIDAPARGAVLAVAALLWIIVLVRVVGLRSFSKMTNFDFVMTVAMGSLVGNASQAHAWPDFTQSLAAMVALFVVQVGASLLRKRSGRARSVLSNEPLLLMRDGRFIDNALRESRVVREDLLAKLRAANVSDPANVSAVVLETTGDISVMHGDGLAETLLEGVRRA